MQKVYTAASCCAPIFQNWFSLGGTVSGSNTGPSFEIQLNPIQTNHHSTVAVQSEGVLSVTQ